MDDTYIDSNVSFESNDFTSNKSKEHELLKHSLRDYILSLCKEKHSIGDENIQHIEDLIENFINEEIIVRDSRSDSLYNGNYFLSSFFHEGFEPDLHDCEKFTDDHDYVLTSFIDFELQKVRRMNEKRNFNVEKQSLNQANNLDYVPNILHEDSHKKIKYFVSNLPNSEYKANSTSTSNGLPKAN